MILYSWRTPAIDTVYVKDLITVMSLPSTIKVIRSDHRLVNGQDFGSCKPPACGLLLYLRPFYNLMPKWMIPYKQKFTFLKNMENGLFFSLLDDAKAKLSSGRMCPSTEIAMAIYPGDTNNVKVSFGICY